MSYTSAPSSTVYPVVSKSPEPWSGAAAQYGCVGCGLGETACDASKLSDEDFVKCVSSEGARRNAFTAVLGVAGLLLAIWAFSAVKR